MCLGWFVGRDLSRKGAAAEHGLSSGWVEVRAGVSRDG